MFARHRQGAPAGFTLIEVLVVVVIVGIISSVVLLSAGLVRDDRDLRQEARRMASLLELASDEALLQGRELGVEIMQGAYRFVEFDPYTGRWNEIVGDELLRQRQLPEALRFELFLEGRRVSLASDPAVIKAADNESVNRRTSDYAPHALIMSSGQLTPFNLQIMRDADRNRIQVQVDAAGNIEVSDGSDEDR